MTKDQIKNIKLAMIKKDLTVSKIADELNTRRDIISQLVNGLYFYPRYAAEIRQRYGIVIPDTRQPRRHAAKAA